MASTTHVDSVVYSMAGDENEIPEFLKSVVIGGILTNPPGTSTGDYLTSTMLNGPGMRLRSFYRWAQQRYMDGEWVVGIPTDYIVNPNDGFFDQAARTAELQARTGHPNAFYSGYRNIFEGSTAPPGDIEVKAWARYLADFPNVYDSAFMDLRCTWNSNTRMVTWASKNGTFPERTYHIPDASDGSQWIHYAYFRDTDDVNNLRWRRYYYKVGTGSVIFDSDSAGVPLGERYLPLLPLRLNNVSVRENEPVFGEMYGQLKKGYKKAFGGRLDDLLDNVEDNENIGDIDYAFIVFGVSLNSKRSIAQRYMFDYFEGVHTRLGHRTNLQLTIGVDASTMPGMTWGSWSANMLRQSIFIDTITASNGTGLMKPGAKVGDVWIRGSGTSVQMTRQLTANTHKTLSMTKFIHINEVYGGVSIRLEGGAELAEEDLSGFIVPISYETLSRMPLAKSSQLAIESSLLVFNCYKVVKQKWYQKGIFKILLVVVVIAVTVASGGFGAGSVGLLGANAAVGAALGFSGLVATIAGAVANMIAAMLVSKLMLAGLTELVGAEWAAIITAIAAAVTMTIGGMDGGGFGEVFKALSDPSLLIRVSSAVGSGIAEAVNYRTEDVLRQTQEVLEQYKEEAKRLNAQYKDMFGTGTILFDPLALAGIGDRYVPEDLDSFLARTLMTGSDVADITMGAVPNYVSQSLDLSLE